MADLIFKINSGELPIIVDVGNLVGGTWIPLPGTSHTYYAYGTYTITSLPEGLYRLRAIDSENCIFYSPEFELFDLVTTTTEEGTTTTTFPCDLEVEVLDPIPVTTTTTTAEPVTTTTEEPTITTTTDYCDPLMVYEIYPNYGVTIDGTFYSRKDSYDLANQALCDYISQDKGVTLLNGVTILTQNQTPLAGDILFQTKLYGECRTLAAGYYSWLTVGGDQGDISDYVIFNVDANGEITEILSTSECTTTTTTTEP